MNFDQLKKYTKARIGLGHAGPALPTKAWLDLAYAHALATDAVDIMWRVHDQAEELQQAGIKSSILHTPVKDRNHYVMRPDLGSVLVDDSEKILKDLGEDSDSILVVVSNGLSSSSVHTHLLPFMKLLHKAFLGENLSYAHKRIFLIPNARVNIIDAVGHIVRPSIGIVIIGERPGLSAPDSLAVYLTYKPQLGLTNAHRNCISNIHPPDGLGFLVALDTMLQIIKESIHKKLSGVSLKRP